MRKLCKPAQAGAAAEKCIVSCALLSTCYRLCRRRRCALTLVVGVVVALHTLMKFGAPKSCKIYVPNPGPAPGFRFARCRACAQQRPIKFPWCHRCHGCDMVVWSCACVWLFRVSELFTACRLNRRRRQRRWRRHRRRGGNCALLIGFYAHPLRFATIMVASCFVSK